MSDADIINVRIKLLKKRVSQLWAKHMLHQRSTALGKLSQFGALTEEEIDEVKACRDEIPALEQLLAMVEVVEVKV
jgi:hypothetical protein